MLPAVLAGGALLAARRRPWVTGALTGLGAAVKLWPALLIAAFCAHRPDRKAAGWALRRRRFRPGRDQPAHRRLDPAGVPVDLAVRPRSADRVDLGHPADGGPGLRASGWRVDISRFQAYEIFGPGVVGLVAGQQRGHRGSGWRCWSLLWVRAYRRRRSSPVAVGLIVLATVAIMTVTNKTLSPQYLLWLGGPMAALLLLRHSASEPERAAVRRLAVQLLLLALLTQLVYPLLYDGLLGFRGPAMVVLATVVTALRNLALVLFTVEVCRLAWVFCSRRGAEVPVPNWYEIFASLGRRRGGVVPPRRELRKGMSGHRARPIDQSDRDPERGSGQPVRRQRLAVRGDVRAVRRRSGFGRSPVGGLLQDPRPGRPRVRR